MDANTDQLLLLGVRKAGSGSKPHLANLAHQVLLLLGTENVSAGTSKHSAVQKLHQCLAEKFNLPNFHAMTQLKGGSLRPLNERRVRSLSPVLAQKVGKVARVGIIDETFTRCLQGVSTGSSVTVEVVGQETVPLLQLPIRPRNGCSFNSRACELRIKSARRRSDRLCPPRCPLGSIFHASVILEHQSTIIDA